MACFFLAQTCLKFVFLHSHMVVCVFLVGRWLGFFCLVFEELGSPHRQVEEFFPIFHCLELEVLFLGRASSLSGIAISSHGIVPVIDFVTVRVVYGSSSLLFLLLQDTLINIFSSSQCLFYCCTLSVAFMGCLLQETNSANV